MSAIVVLQWRHSNFYLFIKQVLSFWGKEVVKRRRADGSGRSRSHWQRRSNNTTKLLYGSSTSERKQLPAGPNKRRIPGECTERSAILRGGEARASSR
jgi:hypothetical protein